MEAQTKSETSFKQYQQKRNGRSEELEKKHTKINRI